MTTTKTELVENRQARGYIPRGVFLQVTAVTSNTRLPYYRCYRMCETVNMILQCQLALLDH